jgi:hypothetical protein
MGIDEKADFSRVLVLFRLGNGRLAAFRMLRATFLLALTVLVPHSAARAAPVLTILHTFTGPPGDGANPQRGMIMKDGVIYGMTEYGGSEIKCATNGCGTVFALSPPASPGGSWTEQVLHNFAGGSDGAFPTSGLVFDRNGVLYGTTLGGGVGLGGVFSLTPPSAPGGAWTEQIIYDFGENELFTSPIVDKRGVLFGTTTYGDVYSLTPPASPGGAWTERTLANVSSLGSASTLIGKDGVLYGITSPFSPFEPYDKSGSSECPCGSVYSVTSASDGSWTLDVLYNFQNSAADGYSPSYLTIGPAGVLYGTTIGDTTGHCFYNCAGTVFSLTPPASPGGAWTEQVLHAFGGSGSVVPDDLKVAGSNATLVGAAFEGGVFVVTPPSTPGGAWSEKTIYQFHGSDGVYPVSVLVSGGVIYGATLGAYAGAPNGTVFALTP